MKILSEFTDEQLAIELVRRGLFDENGLVKFPVYEMGVKILPILCVDVIPIKRESDIYKIGVISRASGPEAGKVAVIGGRVRKDLKVAEAIGLHLKNDLAIDMWKFYQDNNEKRPFYVQQYLQKSNSTDEFGYDPTKHAVALNYIIEIEGNPKPKNEANNFVWITENEIPEVTAYNHGIVMKQVFEFVRQMIG